MLLALTLGFFCLVLVFLEFFVPGGLFALFSVIIGLGSVAFFYMASDSIPLSVAYFLFLALAVGVICRLTYLKFLDNKDQSLLLTKDQEGYSAVCADRSLVGKVGVTVTILRPSGRVRVEGVEVDAEARLSDFIEPGCPVRIVGIEGGSFKVEKMKEEQK